MNLFMPIMALSLVINCICFATTPDEIAESLRTRANQHYKDENFEQALVIYNEALNLDGLSIHAKTLLYRNCGITYAALKNYPRAVTQYLSALKGGYDINKTYCLLAKAKLLDNRLTEALYYLEKTTHDDCQKTRIAAKKRYESMLKEADRTMAQDLIKARADVHYPAIIEELGLMEPARLKALIHQFWRSTAEINIALEAYWRNFYFVPLNRIEQPRLLAEFIKPERAHQTIVCPVIQTLPYHLSRNFSKVIVVDVSERQIQFQQQLHQGIRLGGLNYFSNFYKDQMLTIIADNASPQVTAAFNEIYSDLTFHQGMDNITELHSEIFQTVNQLIAQNNKPDVVFLSTIPLLTPELWFERYQIIRQWLSLGIAVSFSILNNAFASREFAHDMIAGFDDVATRKSAVFEASPIIMHVRLTPKQTP